MNDNKSKISLPQKFYDENREIFGAETTSQDIDKILSNKCEHYFVRKTGSSIECNKCHYGLIDLGKFKLKDGKLI